MMVTDDIDAIAAKLHGARAVFVSSGVILLPKEKAKFSKGLLVADPDGHDVLLIER